MATSDQTPETELELQELTDENVEEVIGGRGNLKLMGIDELQGSTGSPSIVYGANTDELTNAGGHGGDG